MWRPQTRRAFPNLRHFAKPGMADRLREKELLVAGALEGMLLRFAVETFPWVPRGSKEERCEGCVRNKQACGMPFSYKTCSFFPRMCRLTDSPCVGECSCAPVPKMRNEDAKRLGLKKPRAPPNSYGLLSGAKRKTR